MIKTRNVLKLIIAVVVSELAGVIGAIFTTPAISGWYTTLIRPSFSPPNWLFAPVWTLLFALMGIALFLIWKNNTATRKNTAYWFFFIQLILSIVWSIIFFYYHNISGAFIEIIFLWIVIFATIIAFYKISKPAGYLLLPYIVWVSFAAILNFVIWRLN